MDSFLEKLRKAKEQHMRALMTVPDGDALTHAKIRNTIKGLDQAEQLYLERPKDEDED